VARRESESIFAAEANEERRGEYICRRYDGDVTKQIAGMAVLRLTLSVSQRNVWSNNIAAKTCQEKVNKNSTCNELSSWSLPLVPSFLVAINNTMAFRQERAVKRKTYKTDRKHLM
jgi:hypothetical protein